MAFSFEQGTVTQTPSTRQKTSTLGKIGDVLAPSTTEVVRDVRSGEGPSGRDLAGAGLELGSLLLPAGAIARGAGLVGKGIQATRGLRAASSASKIKQELQVTGSLAKRGATVGGVSGGLFGTGQALSDEEKGVTQVLGEGVVGGIVGGVTGGLLAPLASALSRSAKNATEQVSRGFEGLRRTLNPTDRIRAVDDLSQSYRISFFEDRAANLNKIERLSREKGIPENQLLRAVADDGYVPAIDGKLARFGDGIKDAERKIGLISKEQQKLLEPITETTNLKELEKLVLQNVRGRTDVDLVSTQRQIRQIFKSLTEKHGADPSASQMGKILTEMNRRTGAFDKPVFIEDAKNAVAREARNRLDELNPDSTVLRREQQRLFTTRDTMQIMNNQAVDVGFLTSGLGRFMGVVGAGGIGLTVGGPGGLVVAGLMANMGAKGVANLIRKIRFDPNKVDLIRTGLRGDQDLIRKLFDEANPTDKALIERLIK